MEIDDLKGRVAALENQVQTIVSVIGGLMPASLVAMRLAFEEQLAKPNLSPVARVALQDLVEHIDHLTRPD